MKKNVFVASTAEAPAETPAAAAPEPEEPEDPKPAIEEACAETAECKPVKARFEACTERVNNSESSGEDCVEVSLMLI